jgi:hypothetical protein
VSWVLVERHFLSNARVARAHREADLPTGSEVQPTAPAHPIAVTASLPAGG